MSNLGVFLCLTCGSGLLAFLLHLVPLLPATRFFSEPGVLIEVRVRFIAAMGRVGSNFSEAVCWTPTTGRCVLVYF